MQLLTMERINDRVKLVRRNNKAHQKPQLLIWLTVWKEFLYFFPAIIVSLDCCPNEGTSVRGAIPWLIRSKTSVYVESLFFYVQ